MLFLFCLFIPNYVTVSFQMSIIAALHTMADDVDFPLTTTRCVFLVEGDRNLLIRKHMLDIMCSSFTNDINEGEGYE